MMKSLLSLFLCWALVVQQGVAYAMELGEEQQSQRTTFQYLPQDIILHIFSFIDYPTLGKSRRISRTWHQLITDNLPIKQRYTLKLIQQFPKSYKTFEEFFLTQLPDTPVGTTALDEIIDELQDELGGNKEQAYQALLDTKLMQTCPSIEIILGAEGLPVTTTEIIFPYVFPSLLSSELNAHSHEAVCIVFKKKDQNIVQLFGLKNLAFNSQSKMLEIHLSQLNLKKLPQQICKLSDLHDLYAHTNQLSTLPPQLGLLSNLEHLELNNNMLTSLPSEVRLLTNLRYLYLGYNQLSSIPPEIGQLNLYRLYLYNNELSSIPPEIGQLTQLGRLLLGDNHLKSIPSEIGQLTNLYRWQLSNNQLTSLPSEIRQLSDLEELYLHNNQLSNIPAEIGQLTSLSSLSLNNNQLSNVPAEIGQLIGLSSLSLNNNQLSSIPITLGQLTRLKALKLNNNQLNSVPSEITKLTNLRELDLDNNPLNQVLDEIKKALLNCNIKY